MLLMSWHTSRILLSQPSCCYETNMKNFLRVNSLYSHHSLLSMYLLLLFSLFSIIYKIVNKIHIYENLEEFKIIVASFRFLRLPPMSWVCFSLLELDLDISEIVSSFGWACSDCEGSLLDLILMTAWLFNFDILTASAGTFNPPPACLLEFEQQLSLLQGFVQYSIWNIASRRPKPYQNKGFGRHYVW